MAKNDNLKDFLTDVADAIREKEGSTGLINPQEFSERIRAIEVGGDNTSKPNVANGVYVHSNDGRLFTITEWNKLGFSNSVADGVAVISDEAAFVICPNELGNMSWSSNTADAIEGVPAVEAEEAASDLNGEQNTRLILATDTSGAAYTCANYIFSSGKKGYLPSAGEWAIAYNNKAAITETMALIGGDEIGSQANFTVMWTSTQASSTKNAHTITWSSGKIGGTTKQFYGGVRAFMKLW